MMPGSPAMVQALQFLQQRIYDPNEEEYRVRRQHYRTNPVDFVREVLLVDPAPYQERVLNALVVHKRVCVRSLHGVGKTALAAWVVLWVISCFDGDVKCVTTASVWRQLTRFLWPEIRKWAMKADWDRIGIQMRDKVELLKQSIEMGGKQAFPVASDTPSSIEGAHADTLLYVFDESKAIPDDTFDAVEGAFSTAGDDAHTMAFALAISTPGPPVGRFYDIHQRKPGTEDWYTDHVTLDEAIAAGRISRAWAEEKEVLWGGAGDPRYKNRVLGEFADAAADSIVKLSWLEEAHERWRERNGKGAGDLILASDVADEGADESTIGKLRGNVVEAIETFDCSTMQLAQHLAAAAENRRTIIAVDSIGVGAGVYSRLVEELHYENTVSFKASYRTDESDVTGENKFLNLRALSYWRLRQALDPDSPGFMNLALPPDDELTTQLLNTPWTETAGVIRIIPKEQIKKRLNGKSPDKADTLAMLWYVANAYSVPTLYRL